mmetsp:Transcript_24814/g.62392  ORF Transcript_24814/g.62392 Transcript_24814/m.62392 type:complete len:861 (-) Transcript_24814:429-3011(-)|eukprot:CAMPEP_0179009444 /NCGR_PEP_ID=MMETSP0795-20121207/16277_1 /TAXON_ID=88552 /ORGANISM="Amoebophrya sp., Strain Ameob2" /LENGTH=860 /DNA_ID=CAMNT_0020704645 /DNA_START=218 /DNA_END=2800 /DNA_ORIENTATION=-
MASSPPPAAAADGGAPAAAPPADDPVEMMKKKASVNQKEVRSRRFRDSTTETIPNSYRGNSEKEDLLLQHVSEFEQQFISVYGNRFLFLCPPNECDVPKFLPTTIRPTHLPYQELYEYKTAANYVADRMNYEELIPVDKYPKVIPSPATTLDWRAGDSFDFSIILCSLLIGVGYDAYCVSGFAPRFIATKCETMEHCAVELAVLNERNELLSSTTASSSSTAPTKVEGIPKRPPFNKSGFITEQTGKKQAEQKHKEEEAMCSDSDDEEDMPPDSGQRVHCWVLIRKGLRNMTEDVYIECSTGRCYPVASSPYLKVDLIWNHKNLWVNMQSEVPAPSISLNLNDPRFYEYVLVTMDQVAGADGDKDDDGDRDEDEAEDAAGEEGAEGAGGGKDKVQYLDNPPSWSKKIEIAPADFQARYYHGEKVSYYMKSKVERYSPYTQVDGIVRRVILFKDVRRMRPKLVEEVFQFRKDKLVRRVKYPFENRVTESFTAGRPNALKEIEEEFGSRRILTYYPSSRLDGLEKTTEEVGKKVCEYFRERDDRLIYHSVKLGPTDVLQAGKQPTIYVEGIGELAIVKMTLKYSRRPEDPTVFNPSPDYHKIVFYVAEGKIRADLHGPRSKIVDETLTYIKEDNQLRPLAAPTGRLSDNELRNLIQMEKNSKVSFQDVLSKVYNEYGARKKEENHIKVHRKKEPGVEREPVLEKHVYDVAREKAEEENQVNVVSEKTEATEEQPDSKVDFLARYLVDFQGKTLDALQAEFVAKKCKNDFRKRLLDRAQIIQRRLETEQENLKKKRAQMQRRGGDNVEKDERQFEQFQSQAMFRIQILEQRLARHEMHAVKKFVELENALAEDPRLAAMWQKK